MHVTRFILCVGVLALAACTTGREPVSKEAIEDFIFANQLEEQKSLRTGRSDSWRALNSQYALYTGRRQAYLLEFDRLCRSLQDDLNIKPDVRRDSYHIYARFDTLRGCFIDSIYAVTDAQAEELKALGQAPGENNY